MNRGRHIAPGHVVEFALHVMLSLGCVLALNGLPHACEVLKGGAYLVMAVRCLTRPVR